MEFQGAMGVMSWDGVSEASGLVGVCRLGLLSLANE